MRINRTQDPVLKNRVVFTGEPNQIWRLVIIGVVVIMVSFATWAYFYLPWFAKTTVVKTSSINSPVETPPPVATHNRLPVEIKLNDDRIKAEQQLVLPAEQPVVAPPVSNPIRSATLETKVEFSSESTPKETTILPSTPAEPVETVATLEKIIPSVESPVIPEQATAQSTQITKLLAQAQSQLKLTRLTSPQGDNAYETYQTLRKLAPSEADSILDSIIAWYYEQGQKYLQRGRLTGTPENNAYQMYQKIIAIVPKHPSAAQLLQGIIEQLQQQFDKQLQRRQFLTPIGHNAYTTYQELLEVAVHPQDTQPLRNKIVKQLLLEAERQLTEKKYITPKQDNAVDTYQKILAIAPKQV